VLGGDRLANFCASHRFAQRRTDRLIVSRRSVERAAHPLSADLSPRPSPPIAAALLLVVACFLYLGMMGSISDLGSTDPAGRGMGLAFGAMFGLALWIVLGVLLIVGAVKGEMPCAKCFV
jgi:hypothetical protein